MLFFNAMFYRYWWGLGNYRLTDEEFFEIIKVNIVDGNSINLYNSPKYDLAIGKGTVFYDRKGNIIGFKDYYNFNWRWFERSFMAELQTDLVGIAGAMYGAKNFTIWYYLSTF